MSVHIIIDGYNLIRQSSTLSALDQQDLQSGRDTLVDMLVAYKKIKRHKITVVFDGADAPHFSPRSDSAKGIAVRYSRPGETADAVIKRMVARERERALVVSSDRAVMDYSVMCQAAVIPSPEFEARIVMAEYMAEKAAKVFLKGRMVGNRQRKKRGRGIVVRKRSDAI